MSGVRIDRLVVMVIFIASCWSCRQPDRNYPMVQTPVAAAEFYQAGIDAVDREVRSNPNNPDAHYKKALYLKEIGKIDEALSAVKQAINIDPTPEYLLMEANLLYEKQQYELALARVSRAQILGGDYPDLWHLMAKLNYLTGDMSAALNSANTAISKYPEALNFYCILGQIRWAFNDTTSAFNSFKKSARDKETEYQSLYYLAILSKVKGDYLQAFSYLDLALQNHPDDRDLLLEKGTLYEHTNKLDSALLIFHQLRDADTTDWEPLYQMALVYFQRRWYDSTLFYTDHTLRLNPAHLPSMLAQARVYDKRTYYGTSIKKYQEILDIDSTYTPAVEELAILKGKVAYLQKIRKDREANSQVETISPTKPPIRN